MRLEPNWPTYRGAWRRLMQKCEGFLDLLIFLPADLQGFLYDSAQFHNFRQTKRACALSALQVVSEHNARVDVLGSSFQGFDDRDIAALGARALDDRDDHLSVLSSALDV